MELEIPAGAVPEGTTITATPLRSLQGSPFAAAPVGLKLEPSGLVLLQPATLTLPKPSGTGTVVGFGFDGDGEELHLVPATVVGETVELKVWHFSGAGTLTARLSELNAVLGYQTTRAHGRAEQRIAAALIDAAANGSDPAQAIFDALAAWRTSVSNGLQIAGDATRLDFFELAFGEWQAWLAYVQEYRDSLTPAQGSDPRRCIRLDTPVATRVGIRRRPERARPAASARACRARRCATCSGSRPRSCWRRCRSTRPTTPTSASCRAATASPAPASTSSCSPSSTPRPSPATATTASPHERASFWNGTASTTIPLRYRLRDATAGPHRPTRQRHQRHRQLRGQHHPGHARLPPLRAHRRPRHQRQRRRPPRPSSTARPTSSPSASASTCRPAGPAMPSSPTASAPIGPGGTVILRIRLAGDDVAAKTITLTHDAAGSCRRRRRPTRRRSDDHLHGPRRSTDRARQRDDHRRRLHQRRRRRDHDPDPAGRDVDAELRLRGTGRDGSVLRDGGERSEPGGDVERCGREHRRERPLHRGSSPGTFTVTARSVFDPSVTGTAFVQITEAATLELVRSASRRIVHRSSSSIEST